MSLPSQDKVLYSFLSSFGVSAYAATAVPDGVAFPYLTYDLQMDNWERRQSVIVHLYYYGESEATPNDKVKAISDAISYGGKILPCDEGALWVKRGSPWCQAVREDDILIKHRYLILDIDYLTR